MVNDGFKCRYCQERKATLIKVSTHPDGLDFEKTILSATLQCGACGKPFMLDVDLDLFLMLIPVVQEHLAPLTPLADKIKR